MATSLKEDIADILERNYPTGLSAEAIRTLLPGVKKPQPALVLAVLNEMLDGDLVNLDRNKGLWYAG